MRTILIPTLIGAALLASPPAIAGNWEYSTPYCVRSIDGYDDCSYYTLDQCNRARSGAGGSCVNNPHYVPGREKERRPRPRADRK